MFTEGVVLARTRGRAGLGRGSVEGPKVRANASQRPARSYGPRGKEASRLEAEIEARVERAEAVDEAEDARYGEEVRGDERAEELWPREDRWAAIREAKAQTERGGRHPGPPAGAEAPPEWRSSLQAGVRRAGPAGAAPFHRSGEPDQEDIFGRVPAELPCAEGRGGGEPTGGRPGGDGQRERPGTADPEGRCSGARVWRDADAGVGGRRLWQRA